MDAKPAPGPPESCPYCGSQDLNCTRRAIRSVMGVNLLGGLGELFHYASFDTVMCASCGYTQFFAEPLAPRNVRDHPDWRKVKLRRKAPAVPVSLQPAASPRPEDLIEPPGGADDAVKCLRCGHAVPAGSNRCPQRD